MRESILLGKQVKFYLGDNNIDGGRACLYDDFVFI